MARVPATALRREPTEAEFTRQVVAFARLCGWLVYHPLPLRTARGWATGTQGDPGFPDLTAAKAGRLVLAELKVGRGTRSPHQLRWAAALEGLAGAAAYYLWTPAAWGEIETVFRGER